MQCKVIDTTRLCNRVESDLEHSEHCVQLVLPEGDVGGDLPECVDGLQPHLLNLIVEHVHQEVQALLRKACR